MKTKRGIITLLGIFCTCVALSQATLRGNVFDENGEIIIGAIVSLKMASGTGTATDVDGNFELTLKSNQPDTVLVQYMGYETYRFYVNPKEKEVIIKKVMLKPATGEMMNEVVVEARINKGSQNAMEQLAMKGPQSISVLTSEMFSKIGDSDMNAAIKRVSGVSQSNGFIVVRGISDRYIQSNMNGLRIPTLDPLTNNIKADMFPASLISNITITKSMTPDLPADWSGAYINFETKQYPDKFFMNVKTSFGYNSQTTFNPNYAVKYYCGVNNC